MDSTQQKDFDHIFVSLPDVGGTKNEDFFEWVKRLESACLQGGRDTHNKAPRKVEGDVRTYLMVLPVTLLWSLV